ncbi:MAG: CDP-diacylglycerol--glycerol-3-phosphate 3-phosphatidyltransferase [Fidelibacterota bacterium]
MMTVPNILTILRILLTPFFIVCLFADFPFAKIWALVIFVIASTTDAYDGYYARKYNAITDSGRFLDPLADKILVSSAFISFAVMGLIDFWMVGLIIFRDLFVTGLRMIISAKGFTMLTSRIAKMKTTFQVTLIILTLVLLGMKGLHLEPLRMIISFMKEFRIIYYLTLLVTFFTVYTGLVYLYDNRATLKKIFI